MSASANKSVLAVLGAAAILCWAPGASAQDAPVLVGTWTLNIDKTEPARDRVIEEPEGTGAGRTMRTGLGGRGGRARGGSEEAGARVAAAGYRFFTSVEAFQNYVIREVLAEAAAA